MGASLILSWRKLALYFKYSKVVGIPPEKPYLEDHSPSRTVLFRGDNPAWKEKTNFKSQSKAASVRFSIKQHPTASWIKIQRVPFQLMQNVYPLRLKPPLSFLNSPLDMLHCCSITCFGGTRCRYFLPLETPANLTMCHLWRLVMQSLCKFDASSFEQSAGDLLSALCSGFNTGRARWWFHIKPTEGTAKLISPMS